MTKLVYVSPLATQRKVSIIPTIDALINEVAGQSTKSYSWILNRILYLYLKKEGKLEKYKESIIEEYFMSRSLDD